MVTALLLPLGAPARGHCGHPPGQFGVLGLAVAAGGPQAYTPAAPPTLRAMAVAQGSRSLGLLLGTHALHLDTTGWTEPWQDDSGSCEGEGGHCIGKSNPVLGGEIPFPS